MDPFVKTIQVEPKEIVKKNIINNINLKIINMKLKSFVNLSAMTKENDKIMENHTFHLSGNDYENWDNDDYYLIQYTLDKLNLIPKIPKTD